MTRARARPCSRCRSPRRVTPRGWRPWTRSSWPSRWPWRRRCWPGSAPPASTAPRCRSPRSRSRPASCPAWPRTARSSSTPRRSSTGSEASRTLTGFRTRVLLDYTAALGFDIDAGGLGSMGTDDGHPLKVRYKKVGLEFDDAKTEWYEKVGLVYEDVSFEVSDPGPLEDRRSAGTAAAGHRHACRSRVDMVRVRPGVRARSRRGLRSTGRPSGAPSATAGSPPSCGASASASISPGVLRGEGRLVLGDGGAFKAAIELDLVTVGGQGHGRAGLRPRLRLPVHQPGADPAGRDPARRHRPWHLRLHRAVRVQRRQGAAVRDSTTTRLAASSSGTATPRPTRSSPPSAASGPSVSG